MSAFDKDSWDGQRALVLHTLENVAECQEEQSKEIAQVRSDLRLLDFKMMMIGFVAALITSAVVSAVVSLVLAALKK